MVRTDMTALLTADEAAALHVGLNVIVRPGDECSRYAAEGYGRSVLDCPTRCESSCTFVAPPAWVALTGPCPTTDGSGAVMVGRYNGPDCRDGRRVEPLYSRQWCFNCDRANENDCHACDKLVGRAAVVSIEPEDDGRNFRITLDVVEVA